MSEETQSQLTLFAGDSLAKTSAWLESVLAWLESGADFGLSSDELLRSLRQRGSYGWAYRVLDSQYYGVAQRRRRVFIVANLGNPAAAAKVLFEPESRDWDSAPRREKGQSYSFSAGASPAAGSIGWQNEQSPTLKSASGSNSVPAIVGTLAASGAGLSRPADQGNELDFFIPEIARAITSGEVLRQKVDQDTYMAVPRTFTVRGGSGNGGKGYLEEVDGGMTLGGQPQWVWDAKQITSKANRSQPKRELSHTLARDSQMHVGVRRLTPVECERLQGFPDGWTDEHSDTQRYKMMGNAVTVNVAEWIGRRIMAVA